MLLRLMRYFTLLFVMAVGFNAQADTYAEFALKQQPLQVSASIFVKNIESNIASHTQSCVDLDNAATANKSKPLCQSVGESEQRPISFLSGHSYELALPITSRYISTGRLMLNNLEPDYKVEIELSIPPSPSFVIGYAVNINRHQHWLTNTSPSKSRISGWKDSNLLYSHRQYPAVLTFS